MSTPKPYPTLPDAAQRDTKRKRATMQRFNAAIDDLMRKHGATLEFECLAPPDGGDILGYDVRRWRITTRAGGLTVSPAGHSVLCRFDDPERAAPIVGTWTLNTFTGKWNHHYFGCDHDFAVLQFTHALEDVIGAGHYATLCGCVQTGGAQ